VKERTKPAPELFSTREEVEKLGYKVGVMKVPVSPEGCYMGNGQASVPEGRTFRVTGFDINGWEGIGYFKTK